MARPIREANWGRVADGIENILREAARARDRLFCLAPASSHGDRHLGHSSHHTQVPVPQ